MIKYIFINTQNELDSLCTNLQTVTCLAIDTEFIRRHAYYSQLCLIQLSYDPDSAFIIDILATLDLTELLSIIYREDIIKIFHASHQDLEIFYNLQGFLPKNLFDTQIALMALGFAGNTSFEKMVQAFCVHTLDKSQTISKWQIRPLSVQQLEYAGNDVVYLYRCYEIIHKQLLKRNKFEFLTNKFQDLSSPNRYIFDVNRELVRNASQNNPIYLTKLKNLLIFREECAKKLNLNPKFILDIKIVEKLCILPITSLVELKPLLYKKIYANYGESIFQLLQNQVGDLSLKKLLKAPANHELLNLLEILLKFVCDKNHINKLLIATKNDLEDLILHQENSQSDVLQGKRYDLFGKYALDFLKGNLSITILNNQLVFK